MIGVSLAMTVCLSDTLGFGVPIIHIQKHSGKTFEHLNVDSTPACEDCFIVRILEDIHLQWKY